MGYSYNMIFLVNTLAFLSAIKSFRSLLKKKKVLVIELYLVNYKVFNQSIKL